MGTNCFAQISVSPRNIDNVAKEVAFKGTKIMFVDESSTNKEDNLYVFSKIDRDAGIDTMYFQHYVKDENNQWKLKQLKIISHKGVIMV